MGIIPLPVLRIAPPLPLPPRPSNDFDSKKIGMAEFSTHPGHGLTPQRVVGIFKAAEDGYPQQQCDLFEDVVGQDAHLRDQFESRIESVAGRPWIMQAGGDDDLDRLAAQWLETALRDVPDVADMFEHQLSWNGYGWAASEIIWEQRPVRGAPIPLLVPTWFASTPHRRFVFDEHDEPHLLTSRDWREGVPLEPGHWILSRRRHRLTTMAGLMRTATWWSLFKRMAIRDWIVFCERFGLPYVLGKYPDNAPEPEKEALRQAVASIGKDGYAAFGGGGEIEFAKVDGGGGSDSVMGALTALCNAEISKLFSGGTLTSGEGSSTGSYALGRVHETRAFTKHQYDEMRLSMTIEQQLGRVFVHFNGIPARPPRLKIHLTQEIDPLVRVQQLSILANELGMELDEDQVRQENQVKIPSGKALKGTKQTAAERRPGGEDEQREREETNAPADAER